MRVGLAVSEHTRSNQSQMKLPLPERGVVCVCKAADDHIVQQLNQLVVERYARLTSMCVIVVALENACGSGSASAQPPPPRHPECAELPCTTYCGKKWATLLEDVLARPVTHWYRCKFGMLCALVPVVWDGRCLAVCQMVCAQSDGEERFERAVEMLEVLIENYLARDAEYLAKRNVVGAVEEAGGVQVNDVKHPGVLRAMNYIERHLSNPSMTVARVAREVEMNPSYLAHLFSQETGVRMSRHIAERRLALARNLLVETDWQVKRVAMESGHANADWFSHLFRVHMGTTPTRYRREHRV